MRAMKDSGIEWIGEIPVEWHSCKVKYVSSLNGRIGWQGLTSNEYMECGPFLITGTDFKEGKINWENCVHISLERYEEAKQIQIRNGDLLITKDGTIGKVAIVDDLSDKASLNSGVLLIRPLNDEKYVVRFKYYILISEIFWKWYESTKTGNSTILHLYQEKFKEFSYPLPPIPEQTRIASFLDTKCTAIDAAIEKQRASIDKLKEYRQAVITEAVTKGLNSDVQMKDSGVEWIGEIPVGWEKVRIKNVCCHIVDCPHSTPDYSASETPYYCIKTSEINDGNIVWELLHYVSEETYKKRTERLVPLGNDIVYAREGSYGDAVILPSNSFFCLGQRVMLLRTNKKIPNSRFLWYTIRSDLVYLQAKEKNTGSTAGRVNLLDVNEFVIFLPPFDEQEAIIQHLDQKSSAIDSAIEKKEQLIDKLTEYKKSLIYEAVTGKIEVPELSA